MEMRRQIVPFHETVFIVICIHNANHKLLKRILFIKAHKIMKKIKKLDLVNFKIKIILYIYMYVYL